VEAVEAASAEFSASRDPLTRGSRLLETPKASASRPLSLRTTEPLVQRYSAGCRDVQGLGLARGRDGHPLGLPDKLVGHAFSLGAEEQREWRVEGNVSKGRPAMRDECDLPLRQVVPPRQRHAKDRACGGSQRARPYGIGATRRQRDRRPERIGGAQERPDVPRISDAPECEHDLPSAARQVETPIDGDDARRMAERRYLGEELRQDVLAGDEQLDRLDADGRCGLDEVLVLDREESGRLALLARREKLPDEPKLLILT
jgi:hypothetical protein